MEMQFLIIAILLVIVLCLVVRIVMLRVMLRRKQMPQDSPQPVEESAVADQSQPLAEEHLDTDLPKDILAPDVPVEPDKPDDESDNDDKAVTQNMELIAGLHRVLEEEKVFLRPDIHIEDVAKMLLTNRTYVTRLMRQEYGLSFIEYVNVARIQHSQSLLYTTNMTLDEVAERSGFQSTSNYCRAFKRYIGTTPLAWKNSLPK